MKIGRDRAPLTERLNDQAESPADSAVGLIASHLKRFENNFTTSLSGARITIENDIKLLTEEVSMAKQVVSTQITPLARYEFEAAQMWYSHRQRFSSIQTP